MSTPATPIWAWSALPFFTPDVFTKFRRGHRRGVKSVRFSASKQAHRQLCDQLGWNAPTTNGLCPYEKRWPPWPWRRLLIAWTNTLQNTLHMCLCLTVSGITSQQGLMNEFAGNFLRRFAVDPVPCSTWTVNFHVPLIRHVTQCRNSGCRNSGIIIHTLHLQYISTSASFRVKVTQTVSYILVHDQRLQLVALAK